MATPSSTPSSSSKAVLSLRERLAKNGKLAELEQASGKVATGGRNVHIVSQEAAWSEKHIYPGIADFVDVRDTSLPRPKSTSRIGQSINVAGSVPCIAPGCPKHVLVFALLGDEAKKFGSQTHPHIVAEAKEAARYAVLNKRALITDHAKCLELLGIG